MPSKLAVEIAEALHASGPLANSASLIDAKLSPVRETMEFTIGKAGRFNQTWVQQDLSAALATLKESTDETK